LDPYLSSGEALGRQPAVGSARVSSPSGWAPNQGIEVLRNGGNAVDAALAVSAALMVAVPHQCSPGGDAFWLIRPPGGPTVAINASGFAGRRADAHSLRAQGHRAIPARSAMSVTVPGVVDGWRLAQARFATRGLPELVDPIANAANEGLLVTPYLARQLTSAASRLGARPEARRVFMVEGGIPAVGTRLRLPDLAETLRRLAGNPRELYEGEYANRIAMAVEHEQGAIDAVDLAEYEASWEKPLGLEDQGLTVEEVGPNSQGWMALVSLGLLERLASRAPADAPRGHLAVEAAKLALVLRDHSLADPREMRRSAATYLESEWLDRTAARMDPRRANSLAALQSAADIPEGPTYEPGGDTAHFAIVDREGLAVSCIQSLYFDFGSGIIPPGTGMTLQNRGDGFNLVRDHPNELRPRRRPLHTLAPAIATRAGRTALVFGAMGGDAQPYIHLQLLEALRADPDPARATSLPRWIVQRDPAGFRVLLERRSRMAGLLTSLGHEVELVAPFDERMGHAQMITASADGNFLVGAADPRSDGAAVGLS
jgi:gamma-glutamyltranspeptidase